MDASVPPGTDSVLSGFGAAMAELNHGLGAVPLLPLLRGAVSSGEGPARLALGLLTANAQFDPSVVSVTGRPVTGGLCLAGRARISSGTAEASLVPALADGAVRLCLVTHATAGAAIRGACGTGQALAKQALAKQALAKQALAKQALAGPAWLCLDDAFVAEHHTSEPLSWPGDARVARVLDGLAAAVAQLAAESCAAGLRALRRVLAATASAGGVASQSQLVAHEISRFEIEVWLLGAAARSGPADPWPLLCGALEAIRTFVTLTEDLDAEIGLDWAAIPGPWPSRADLGHLGGVRAVQGEDARRIGLQAYGAGR